MNWAVMPSAGVGPLCFLKSTVYAVIYQAILEHFMLPSADKLYGDADFIFQQDLAPAHTAKGIKSWFNDHGVTVLDWPANSPDLNPIDSLSRGRWETPDPTMQMTWRPLIQATWAFITWAVPQTDCLHSTPHWCSNSCKRRPNQVLSALKWTYFSEAWHFCLYYPCFYQRIDFKVIFRTRVFSYSNCQQGLTV